jgi:sigma-B regulation protein RsbU (phosphoserine phosphatase)
MMPEAGRDEYAIAAEVQEQLLPQSLPSAEGFEFGSYYHPSTIIGSDYYDFIEIDRDRLGILVADVSAPGLPGAFVMVQVRTLMRMAAQEIVAPKKVLARLNRALAASLPKGMFVTLFYGLLDTSTSELTACSAGHGAALYWHQSMERFDTLNTNGLALGIDQGKVFEKSLSEMRILMEPGDRLLLHTEGITNVRNARGEAFGPELLAEGFLKKDDQIIEPIVESLQAYLNGTPQDDDVTLVSVRRLSGPARRQRPVWRGMVDTLRRFAPFRR